MSFFWSSWITIFSLACWLFIFGVLIWTLRHRPVLEEDETTGHSYDGIREYDRPLPKWWLWVFFATMFWGLGYFVLYPSIQPNSWRGISTVEINGEQVHWTSKNELNSNLERNNAVFLSHFNAILEETDSLGAQPILANLNQLQHERDSENAPNDIQGKIDDQFKALAPFVDKMAQSYEAQKIGNSLFLQNCALCHGSNAEGAQGYPNLTDNDWLYGGEAENILTTIHKGRVGGMAAWQGQIGERGVRATAEYVMSISATPHDDLNSSLVEQGGAIFSQNCVVCHGQDGTGSTAMGAPNLTDDIWLYGGDRASVQESIRNGRAGVMPAWEARLGNERVMLLAAYVRFLAQNPQ